MNLLNLLKLPRGSVTIKSNGQPAFSLQFKSDNILLDIIDASFFEFADDTDSVGLISKIKNRKTICTTPYWQPLDIYYSSKGYETHPTLSRLITRSNNIQIDSVKEIAKLKHDMDK